MSQEEECIFEFKRDIPNLYYVPLEDLDKNIYQSAPHPDFLIKYPDRDKENSGGGYNDFCKRDNNTITSNNQSDSSFGTFTPATNQTTTTSTYSSSNNDVTIPSTSTNSNFNDTFDQETIAKNDQFLIESINWDEGLEDEFGNEIDLTSPTPKKENTTSVFNESAQFISNEGERKNHTSEFQGSYYFSNEAREMLHSVFGLQKYRPMQEEIINACLQRHDCFVLMPTGGGKSLCYQLPAILTPGVTIVVSPLRALISDQVNKLNSLDIPTAHLCADVSAKDAETIRYKLLQNEPALKLLYLTPEKIVASKMTTDMLDNMYKREKLARFVIDEAHCLSQWGHDFRPDYKQLSLLRRQFPNVPIMCLTATATSSVQKDVCSILKLKDLKTFISSFNRPNIKYAVLKKTAKIADKQIVELIKKRFMKKSGIVYCLCRNDCDQLATTLSKLGIKAASYHAGLTDKVRENVQMQWMNDEFYVVVATIAFGMGIDKPDVRFVIHNSLPKSIEAFYQESGRGGRDGQLAYSYLLYCNSDVIRLQRIIRLDRSQSARTLDAHFDALNQMAQFCENRFDCRRYLQLHHLGEKFDRQICQNDPETICDNCANAKSITSVDCTDEAKQLAELVKDITARSENTLLHIADVYKGAKIKKILERQHDKHKFYGKGAHLAKTDIQQIMRELVYKKVLTDYCQVKGEFPIVYIKPGVNYNHLFTGNVKLSRSVAKRDNVEPSTSATNPTPSTSTNSNNLQQDIAQLRIKCYEELLQQCHQFAIERNCQLSAIMNLSAVKEMSEKLPTSKEQFMNIQYVTKANFDKFGDAFLKVTTKYFNEVQKLEATVLCNDLGDDFFNDDDDESFNSSAYLTFSGKKKKVAAKRKRTYKPKRKKNQSKFLKKSKR